MKQCILCFLLFFSIISSAKICNNFAIKDLNCIQNDKDRELTQEEVKRRGIGLLVTKVIDNIEEINLKNMARSSIFETSYGFRWKMFNLKTGKILIIKVDKDFKLISARNSKNLPKPK